ncbi:MAG: type II toxin-antitoxin system HicB family antitoxin [Flavobacteriales bacterium]|nr:type II toxin-antitoxin system HicB family antitoxin [Flavobacteriales bacterium]
MDGYIEYCKAKGLEPQKSYSGTFNIRIPKDLHQTISLKAKMMGITINSFTKKALETYTNQQHGGMITNK